jgi:hypothetical protein
VVPTTNTFLSLVAGQLPDWDWNFHTIIDAFSGGVYNPYWGTFGAMIFHGGGHVSTYDNSVLMLDFNDLTFKRLSNASPQSTFTHTDPDPLFDQVRGAYADGQVGSGHSFDMLAIMPPADGGAAAGSLLKVSGQGVHFLMKRSNNWAWRFDITPTMTVTRGSWMQATDNAPSDYMSPGACSAYDPTRKRVWWISTLSWQPPFIRYLDIDAHSQVTVRFISGARLAPPADPDSMSMRYHAALDIVILTCTAFGNVAIAYLQCSRPEAGWFWPTLSAQIPAHVGRSHPFDYVPEIDRYVMLAPADDRAVYEIAIPPNPTSIWSVTRRTFTGLTTIPVAYVAGKRWSYAPAVKAFVWLARSNEQLYVYRPLGT